MIFNHFSFKTCAIIGVSQGKVNFVIQIKHLKGESSNQVKQNRRLMISLH